MATLHEVIAGLPYEVLKGSTSCALAGITADSRKVQPGWAFVAIPGEKVDGHSFVPAGASHEVPPSWWLIDPLT